MTALEQEAVRLFIDHKKTLGSRRLKVKINELGFSVGRYKVRSLMKKLALFARYPKRHKITTDSAHNHSIVPNLLAREFTVTQREEVWTTDITYVWTYEGWMYLAVVMDLYSRQIIGWAMAAHMKTALCVQALQMAYWRRKPPKGLLHHSDRGSQYTRHQYRAHLQVMGVQASMSGKGQGWDNAPTERFFRSLKYEYLNYEILKTRNDAKLGGLDYLAYYNSRRPHSLLAYFSPIEFELIPVINLS